MGLEPPSCTGGHHGLEEALQSVVTVHGLQVFRMRTGHHRHGDATVKGLQGFTYTVDDFNALDDPLTEQHIALFFRPRNHVSCDPFCFGQHEDVLPLTKIDLLIVRDLEIHTQTSQCITGELEIEEFTVDKDAIVVPQDGIERTRRAYDSSPLSKSRESELMQ